MAINGINNGTVSWAQFVTAAQAARQRNSALSVNGSGNSAVNTNTSRANVAVSLPKPPANIAPKVVNNVYSTYGKIKSEPSVQINNRPVGGMFDAYA